MRLFSKKYWKILLVAAFVILMSAYFLTSIFYQNSTDGSDKVLIPDELELDYKLKDNQELYIEEDVFKVYEAYLTVYTGLDNATGKEFNLQEFNKIKGFEYDPELKSSIYIIDKDTGKVVGGDQLSEINSTVELRGQSARRYNQKSYKVNLSRSTEFFQGQKELNLNKHVWDNTRVVQKFSFDSMIGMENFVSVRSNFMNLYIKDGTDADAEFENYGLFTHIENIDDDYLFVRGLDENANLIKPLDFIFSAFEAELIKAGKKNTLIKDINIPSESKLIEMIEAVNKDGIEFDKTFGKYFDQQNYLTWLAVNILLNNNDTTSRNFILYSPSNFDKWYFTPWDYDASMTHPVLWEAYEHAKWSGLQRYWTVPLHRKFFQDPDNIKKLNDKIDKIYNDIMGNGIELRCEKYAEVFEAYVMGNEADRSHIEKLKGYNFEILLDYIRQMPDTLTYNYKKYYERLEAPMTFFLGEIEDTNQGIRLNWQDSYDLQNDIISYDVSIFTNPEDQENSSIWAEESDASNILIKELILEDGIYYWQAVAKDQHGNRQVSFDRCRLETGYNKLIMFEMKKFTVIDGVIRRAGDQ